MGTEWDDVPFQILRTMTSKLVQGPFTHLNDSGGHKVEFIHKKKGDALGVAAQ